MTLTYDEALTDPKDQVRLYVGDVTTTDQLLSDEEIEFLLLLVNGDAEEAAGKAIDAIIARLAKQVTKAVGKLKIELSDRYDHYVKMRSGEDGGGVISQTALSVPVLTGSTVSEKETEAANPDVIPPHVRRGQHDALPEVPTRRSYDYPYGP